MAQMSRIIGKDQEKTRSHALKLGELCRSLKKIIHYGILSRFSDRSNPIRPESPDITDGRYCSKAYEPVSVLVSLARELLLMPPSVPCRSLPEAHESTCTTLFRHDLSQNNAALFKVLSLILSHNLEVGSE
jgi:hypothetical protein